MMNDEVTAIVAMTNGDVYYTTQEGGMSLLGNTLTTSPFFLLKETRGKRRKIWVNTNEVSSVVLEQNNGR